MRAVAVNAGINQQGLAAMLGMLPSRLVPLIDELEERALLERRDQPEDRRRYALHLTELGGRVLADIGRVAKAHDDAVCAALKPHEREQLSTLLRRLADDQGLTPGVHPGFAELRSRNESAAPERKRKGAASNGGRTDG